MRGSKILRSREQGVGLMEVLVALAIFAAVGVVFLMGLQTSGKAVIISQENVTAEGLAKSKMEDVKGQAYVVGATTYTVIPVPADLIAHGYAVTVAAASLPQAPYNNDPNIQKITIIVTYRGNTSFTLVDYKVKR